MPEKKRSPKAKSPHKSPSSVAYGARGDDEARTRSIGVRQQFLRRDGGKGTTLSLEDWFDQVVATCPAECQTVAERILGKDIPVPTMDDRRTLLEIPDEDEVPSKSEMSSTQLRILHYAEDKYDREVKEDLDKCGKLIAYAMEHIERELHDAIVKEYPAMRTERNLVTWRKAVIRCFKEEYTYVDTDLIRIAEKNLAKLLIEGQGDKETLARFKERFLRAHSQLESLGCPPVTENMKAEQLVHALHRKFAPLVVSRANTKKAGIGMPVDTEEQRMMKKLKEYVPDTVELVYQQAMSWKVDKSESEVAIQLATVNKSLQRQLSEAVAERKERSGKAKVTSPPKAEKQQKNDVPQHPCYCGELHWQRDCQYKDRIRELLGTMEKLPAKEADGDSPAPASAKDKGSRSGGKGNKKVSFAGATISAAQAWADDAGAGYIDLDLESEYGDDESHSYATISYTSMRDQIAEKPHLALLDSCASDFTIKSQELVRGIHAVTPMQVITVFGTGLIGEQARSQCFGDVWFDANSPFNVWPRHQVERMYKVTDYKHDGITCRSEVFLEPYGITIVFDIVNNVMLGDISALIGKPFIKPPPMRSFHPELAIAAASAKSPELAEELRAVKRSLKSQLVRGEPLLASNRQLEEAIVARRLQRNLGYMSSEDVRKSLAGGAFRGTKVHPSDCKHADKLLDGQDENIIKGKSKMIRSESQNLEKLLKDRELVLYVDLFKTGGGYYLLSTASPGSYSEVYFLGYSGARATANIDGPLIAAIESVKPLGFTAKFLSADNEGAIKNLKPKIDGAGVTFVPRTKAAGVPVVDNKMKVIKERMRCIIAGLAFVVGLFLYPHLVSYVVKMINFTPTTTNIGDISPYQFMTGGRSVDVSKIAAYPWGQYGQVPSGNRLQSNLVTQERTHSAIYVGPEDEHGRLGFVKLQTMKYISRDQFTPLPMPVDVIDRLNEAAKLKPADPDDDDDGGGDEGYDDNDDGDYIEEVPPTADPPYISTPGVEHALRQSPQRDDLAERLGVEDHAFERVPLTPGNGHTPSPFRLQVSPGESRPPPGVSPLRPSRASPTKTAARASPRKSPSPLDLNAEMDMAIDKPSDFEPTLRRSNRVTQGRLPKRYQSATITLATYADLKCGVIFTSRTSMHKALKGYGKDAIDALIDEMDGMLKRKVWHGVLLDNLSATQRKKIIRSSVFFKEKYKDGVFDRLKARLVGGGDQQDKSLYDAPTEISSPTVSTTSVFSIISTAAAKQLDVVTFDIGQAYLNADMPGEVYVTLDPVSARILCQLDPSYLQFLGTDGKILVQLDKALYGCVESARLFYEHLKGTLSELDYSVNPLDPCVFTKPCADGGQTTVCFHVDDGLATSPDAAELKKLVKKLRDVYQDLKVTEGVRHEYLGMLLDFSEPGQCEATMRKYIADIIEEFGVTGLARTPAGIDLFDIDVNSVALPTDLKDRFHRATAQCLYLATHVRPDILVAVSFLTTRVQAPTQQDLKKLIRLLRYLNHTQDLGLVLGGDSEGNFHLAAYVDASFGVHADGKSHTGMFITLGRGLILAKSVKQKIVTKSSCEAELVGLSDISSLLAWQQEWMSVMGYSEQAYSGVLYEDNMSAMSLARNGRSNSDRTKHIKLRYFFIKQYLDSGEFVLKHCTTDRMIADILTKPLQGDHFESLRSILLGYAVA